MENKAANNSIFSCKRKKESFHPQHADVRQETASQAIELL